MTLKLFVKYMGQLPERQILQIDKLLIRIWGRICCGLSYHSAKITRQLTTSIPRLLGTKQVRYPSLCSLAFYVAFLAPPPSHAYP